MTSNKKKIKDIEDVIKHRFEVKCEDTRDWMEHYETLLRRIEDILDGRLLRPTAGVASLKKRNVWVRIPK